MSELEHEAEETRYRAYVTDALKIIAENIAGIAGGYTMTSRWADNLNKQEPAQISGDEIAKEVMAKAGLSFGGDE